MEMNSDAGKFMQRKKWSMQNIKYLLSLAALSLLLGCNRSETATGSANDNQSTSSGSSSASATSRDSETPKPANDTSAASVQPDNTGKNVRDRSAGSLTPGDQGGSESDREISRRIRQALTSNDQLSTDAKNIKVITLDGKVTLRGPVNSPEEQKTIDSIVKDNGGTAVDDQLEVKAPKTQ
jgi:hypothetical protein